MENVHMPAVLSGPRSDAHTANGNGEGPKSIFDLMAEKDSIESELSTLNDVLESHGIDMNTPLTDRDGFPRSDIDVAQVRTTRARAIYLRNDLKAVMAKIEPALHEHFAKAQEGGVDAAALPPSFARSQPALSTRRLPVHTGREPDVTLRPFAKVNSVVSDSPADRAGLQAGDEVLRFGEVDWRSPDKLGKVAATTSRSEGRDIRVRVSRRATSGMAEHLELVLTPRSDWGGRGLLGCHIIGV